MPGRARVPVGGIITGLTLVLLFAPLVAVVIFSFHRVPSLSLPFQGFSLVWYRDVFGTPAFVDAIIFGLKVSLTVTAISIVTTVPAAYTFARSPSRLAAPLSTFVLLPVALPGIFLGPAILVFMRRVGIANSFETVVIGQLIVVTPLMLIIIRNAIERLDPALEEVARDLGAGSVGVFFRVVIPIIWPLVFGASCLVFVISFDEFPVTFFLVGAQSNVPMFIYGLMQETVDPAINAVSALMLLIILSALGLGGAVIGTRSFLHRLQRGNAAAQAVGGG